MAHKTYLIKLPQNNETSAASFEQVLIQLHETLGGEQVSLELVAIGQNVGFFFTADPAAAQVVAGQIYAVAPESEIVEVGDFTRNQGKGSRFVSSELRLVRNDLFPLRDYRDHEGDSLSGVLSVLS